MTDEQPPTQYVSNYPRSHVDFDPEAAQALLEGYYGLAPALGKCFAASLLVYFVSGVLFGVAGGSYQLAWIPWIVIVLCLVALVYYSYQKPMARVEYGMGWEPGKHKRIAFWAALIFSPLWGAPVYAVVQLMIARRLQDMGLPANVWKGIKKRQVYEMVAIARQTQRAMESAVETQSPPQLD